MKLKHYKRTLFVSGVYAVLLAVLLVGITFSKYADTKLAYTSFGASSFNVVVLGSDVSADTQQTENGGEQAEPETLSTSVSTQRFLPGMTWSETASENTAAEISFFVANGTTEENASQVGVVYTVRLRTVGSLPLRYSLCIQTGTDVNTGSPIYERYTTLDTEPERIVQDDNSVCYEYTFYHAEAEPAEASFKLDGGVLSENPHKLIVEWPADTAAGTNSKTYMKEVEILELVVKASSLNRLDDDGYTAEPDGNGQYYSGGMVLLIPPEQGSSKSFSYDIDYRSFQFQDGVGQYSFSINNGVDYAITQTADTVSYATRLKVPAELEYSYTVSYVDLNGANTTLSLSNPEYRLYNEKTGDYTSYASMEGVAVSDAALFKWYLVYDLPGGTLYNTEADATGNIVPSGDGSDYTLGITRPEGDVTDDDYVQKICFNNKLELLIEANYGSAQGTGE